MRSTPSSSNMQCYDLMFVFKLEDSEIDSSIYLNELESQGYFYTSVCTETLGFIGLGFKVIYSGSQSEIANFIIEEICSIIPNIELVSLTSVSSKQLINLH